MNITYSTSRDACIVHYAQGLPGYDNKFGGWSQDTIEIFSNLSGGEIRAKVLHYAADNAAESGYRLTVIKQDGFETVEDAKAWAEATYIALSAPAVEQPAAEEAPAAEAAPATIETTIRPNGARAHYLRVGIMKDGKFKAYGPVRNYPEIVTRYGKNNGRKFEAADYESDVTLTIPPTFRFRVVMYWPKTACQEEKIETLFRPAPKPNAAS